MMKIKILSLIVLIFGSLIQSAESLSCANPLYENSAGSACVTSCWLDDSQRYLNKDQTKCVDACPTGTYYKTADHKCLACSAECDDCFYDNTGTTEYCKKCSSGKYLKSDYTGCVTTCFTEDTTTGYGTKLGTGNSQSGTTICVGNCYLYDGTFTSSDYKTCVTSCQSNQFLDTATNAGFAVCTACSIANCKACTSATICTECDTTYYVKSDGTACVKPCTAGTWIDPTAKFCTTKDCNTLNNNYVLNNDANACILKSACATNQVIGKKMDASGVVISPFIYQCLSCSTNPTSAPLTNCVACQWIDPDIMSCKTCSANFLLKQVGNVSTCVATASGACGSTLWLESTNNLKCVGSCFLEDNGKIRSSVAGGLYKCVSACESTEFIDSQKADNPICLGCSSLPKYQDEFTVAGNSVAGGCSACSSDGSKCTSCSSGYLRTDKVECVAICQNEFIPAFLCANKTQCISDCSIENSFRETPTAYTCVTTCAAGSYNNNGVCTPCTTTFGTDCTACGQDGCTTCGSSKYIRKDKLGCVADCVAEDSSSPFGIGSNFLNAAGTACVHDCQTEDSNYILNNAKTQCVQKCATGYFFDSTGSANTLARDSKYCLKCLDKITNCLTCSSLTVCLTCESGYFLKPDKTGCVDKCRTVPTADTYAQDSTATKCVAACAQGKYFDISNSTGADEYYCRDACPATVTYYDITEDKCKLCTTLPGCLECSGYNCSKCDASTYFCNGTCLATNCASCTNITKVGPDKICNSNCHTHNVLYYESSSDANVCVTACSASQFIDLADFKCKACGTNCVTCITATLCTSCDTGFKKTVYNAATSSCVSTCKSSSESYLANDQLHCVSDCYAYDNQRYGIKGSSENNCQDSCPADHKCLPCATNADGSVNADFTYCDICKEVGTSTTSKSCTHCTQNFLQIDGTLGCKATCSAGKQSSIANNHACVSTCPSEGSYLSDSDDNKCITSCSLNSIKTKINNDGTCGTATNACLCVDACSTSQYYDSADYTCKLCSAAMTDCEACTAVDACTSCGNNKYLKQSKTACINDCWNDVIAAVPYHTYKTTTKVRQCVSSCADDSSPTQYLSTDGITCIENCNDDEYKDGNACLHCFSALAGCKKCTSSAVCTSCATGYLDFTTKTCIYACAAYLGSDGTTCYADCASARTYLNTLQTQCVVSCSANDHSYLSKEVVTTGKTECVTEVVCIAKTATYIDNGECKSCKDTTVLGTGFSDCASCKKVGTEVLCYSCTTGTNFVRFDKKACIAGCYATDSTYPFTTSVKKCAKNCYPDDHENGASKLDYETKACILQSAAVPVGSFLHFDGTDYIQYLCKNNPLKDADAAYTQMGLCAKCSSYKVCTECDANYVLRNDFGGCVATCSDDTSAALVGATYKIPSYHATATLKQCIANCSATNPLWAFATDLQSCVLATTCTVVLQNLVCGATCPDYQYKNTDAGATLNYCINMEIMGEDFRYCKAGTHASSALTCNTCKDGYKKKKKTASTGDKGCIYDCSLDGTVLNEAGTECTTDCSAEANKIKHQTEAKCVTACDTGYIPIFATSFATCVKCSALATGQMDFCKLCVLSSGVTPVTSSDALTKFECTECSNGYLFADQAKKPGCSASCSETNYAKDYGFDPIKCSLVSPNPSNCSTISSIDGKVCLKYCSQDSTQPSVEPTTVASPPKCVAACAVGEYYDTTHKCIACATPMPKCSVCLNESYCITCIATFLMREDHSNCTANTDLKIVCPSGEVLTVNNDPDAGAQVCVKSPCYLNDYTSPTSYLKEQTAATTECVATCATDEYYDNNYECKKCSSTFTSCIKCSRNTLNVLVCTECVDTNNYLKIDGSACVTNCTADTAGTYGYNDLTDSNKGRCIQSCNLISGYESIITAGNCVKVCAADGKDGLTTTGKLAADGIKCVAACTTDTEYLNSTNNQCLACSFQGGYYENCTKCALVSTTVTCTECTAGYFVRNNLQGCIRDCQADKDTNNPFYADAALTPPKCLTKTECTASKKIMVDLTCGAACGANEYDTGDKVCHKCTEIDPWCATCSTTAATCLTCVAGHYLGLNTKANKCVDSCRIDDNSFLEKDGSKCVSSCTSPAYSNVATTKCITASCYDEWAEYLNLAGTACVTVCPSKQCPNGSNQCIDCPAGCLKCHFDAAAKCDQCDDSYWLGIDLSCTSGACASGQGLKYETTATSNLICIENCTQKSQHLKQGSTTECVKSCAADTEFANFNLAENLTCTLCSTLTNCATCVVQEISSANKTVCLTCSGSNVMKSTKDQCGATCLALSEFQYIKYTNDNQKLIQCVAACSDASATLITDTVNGKCVDDCGVGFFTVSATKVCQACTAPCTNCTETQCLVCPSPNYLGVNKLECAGTCSTGYISKNTTFLHCVANCVTDDDAYLNASAPGTCVDLHDANCAILNLTSNECVSSCTATTEAIQVIDTNTKICRPCSFFISYCEECSTNTTCTKCATGTALEVATNLDGSAKTSVKCLEYCPSGEYLAGANSISCLAHCDANAVVSGNNNIASSGLICVAACEADEYISTASGHNVCKKCSSDVALTNANITMKFCKTCSAEKVCTLCLSGYLWTSTTDTGCAIHCQGLLFATNRGYESSVEKKCVGACEANTYPLATGDEAAGTLHIKCVSNCWTTDKQYLNQAGTACVNQCGAGEYQDESADPKQCKLCSIKDAHCTACTYDSSSGTPWKCSLCDISSTKYYVSLNKSKCVTDCYVEDGQNYPRYIQVPTEAGYYMCVDDCFDDDQQNFARDVSGTWKCVQECLSTEYPKTQASIPKRLCTLCSANTDATYGTYFSSCIACSSANVCTACSEGYIRHDNKGCIQECKNDPDTISDPTQKFYQGTDGIHCWASCKDQDGGKAVNYQGTACTAACDSAAFLDTSGADNFCKLCANSMPNCLTCQSATVCTSCENPTYLKVSKTGCVASCKNDDSSFAKSSGTVCTSACEANEYSNNGQCEACSTPTNQDYCIKCTDSTHCQQCTVDGSGDAQYATAFPGVNKACWTACSGDGSHLQNLAVPLICVQSCSSGEFVNNQNKCQLCSEVIVDCLTCSGMYSCTTCDTNSLNKYRSSDSKTCVAKCGDYSTLDSTGVFCEACSVHIPSCLACKLEGTTVKCTKCNYGYLTINSTCSEICATPYIKLASDLNNQAGNICTASCPLGTVYQNSTNSCEICHKYCKTCSAVNDQTKCLICIDTMYKNGNYCVACPEGYFWDDARKECVIFCQDKFYKNNETRTCDPCHSNCLTCNGPLSNQCTSCSGLILLSGICAEYNQDQCPAGQYLVYSISQSNCVQTCPSGMYADSGTQTCENCDTTCLTCSAGDAYSCLSCESSRIFNEAAKTCVLICPEGTYQTTASDNKTKLCSICNTGCKRCETKSDNCLSCEIGYYLFQSNCISTCQNGYYAKTNPRECALCDEACLTCIGGFAYTCLSCNSSAGLILITELDQSYGTCKNKSDVLSSIESESQSFNEDNYVTSYSVASQANILHDALTTANITNSTSAAKSVQQFTALASKKSAAIETSDDALYLVDSISQLNNISGVSSDDSLTNSIETLNNVIQNENIAMDKNLFGKMVSSWSNLYQRNKEVIVLTSSSAQDQKKKSREFNAKLAQYNNDMIDQLKIAVLGNSEEQLEFTTKSNAMSAKIKKVNNKVAQTLNLGITREELTDKLRQRILMVRRSLGECQQVTNIGQPLVTIDDGCVQQLPSQTLLVQFINYQMNTFAKYTYAQDIKSNVILYTIIDGSTLKATTIETAKDGYLKIDIPLQELLCDSEDNEFVCVRWDDQIKDWSDNGMETIQTTDLYVQCQTRKLGYFAIIEREKFNINREVKKNYGFMSIWFILILGIILYVIGIAMSIGEQKQNPVDPQKLSQYEQAQYDQGKIRKLQESQVPLTINPLLSLFLSQKMTEFIQKIIQFITDDLYLMVPLPLLSIFITWVCNYILGYLKMKFNINVYCAIAFLYYAGMSVGISLEMKGATDDRSHKFAYSALLGLAIDLIIFDGLLILVAKTLKLPRKMIWNFFLMGGFAEDEFMYLAYGKQIVGGEEERQKLSSNYTEQPNIAQFNNQQDNAFTNQQEIQPEQDYQQEVQQDEQPPEETNQAEVEA